jgi:hypothetical protein
MIGIVDIKRLSQTFENSNVVSKARIQFLKNYAIILQPYNKW